MCGFRRSTHELNDIGTTLEKESAVYDDSFRQLSGSLAEQVVDIHKRMDALKIAGATLMALAAKVAVFSRIVEDEKLLRKLVPAGSCR